MKKHGLAKELLMYGCKNGFGNYEFAAGLLIFFVLLCSGCSLPNRKELLDTGTVTVQQWLGKGQSLPISQYDRLGSVLGELDHSEITTTLQSISVEDQELKDIISLYKTTDLISLSRGNRLWYFPKSMLFDTKFSNIKLKTGDQLSSIPFEATVFATARENSPQRTIQLFFTGPLATMPGNKTFKFIQLGRKLPIKNLIKLGRSGELVSSPVFVPDKIGGQNNIANVVVVNRLMGASRLASLALPTHLLNDLQVNLATNMLQNTPLQDGDAIEISEINLLFDKYFEIE